MDAWRPKHVEDQGTIKWLWKCKCIKLVTLLWYCCWFSQKWPSNRIKNDSSIYEHPQDIALQILREDFCSREFFLLHDNPPAHKAESVCQFLTQKMLQPFIIPVPSTFISAKLFSVLQVENEVTRTPLCGFCWDPRRRNGWSKKRNFRQLFRNCTTAQKPVYVPMELILNKKSYESSSCVSDFKKNQP
jgi:hypothetical protein